MIQLYKFQTLLVLIIYLTLTACTSHQFFVEKTADFQLSKERVKHIISISPNFTFPPSILPEKEDGEVALKEEQFLEKLIQSAKNQGIILQVEGAGSLLENYNSEYFEYLAPFKKAIYRNLYLNNFEQINALNTPQTTFEKYEKGIPVPSHFSHLAEKYGTPYFALQGFSFMSKDVKEGFLLAASLPNGKMQFMTKNAQLVYYTIIVNAEISEIIYHHYIPIGRDASPKDLEKILTESLKVLMQS